MDDSFERMSPEAEEAVSEMVRIFNEAPSSAKGVILRCLIVSVLASQKDPMERWSKICREMEVLLPAAVAKRMDRRAAAAADNTPP